MNVYTHEKKNQDDFSLARKKYRAAHQTETYILKEKTEKKNLFLWLLRKFCAHEDITHKKLSMIPHEISQPHAENWKSSTVFAFIGFFRLDV